MRRFLRENGLSLAMFGLFAVSILGHSIAGYLTYNEDEQEHNQAPVSYVRYLTTGTFVESVFENWESEFLQMGMYVLLTAYLFQKGSPESKKLDEENPEDEDPRESQDRPGAPRPVGRGGMLLKLYEHSLTGVLFLLFFMSMALHTAGGAAQYNQEQMEHGGETISTLQYLLTPRFWFESFQNWQSEFFSVGMLGS